MKIKLPYAPRARLTELIARRRQTLTEWVREMGITSRLALELYCVKHKLEVPSPDESLTAFASMAFKSDEVHTVPAKPVEVVPPTLSVPEPPPEPETKKSRKARLAAFKEVETIPDEEPVSIEPLEGPEKKASGE